MKPIEIACAHVGKEYQTSKQHVVALEDVSLRVEPGEFVSLLGPSGCGKTTLLRLIGGLEASSSGSITIDEVPVNGPHPELGIVFQTDLLMPWRTVIENVLLQSEVRKSNSPAMRERAKQLLAQVGLSGFENSFPHQLSGGMKQRVGICRALLHEPRLLLMDEPFAALDAMTRDQLSLDLTRLAVESKTTIVFVTHSIPEAVFLSNRVLVMSARPGKIVADMAVDLPFPRTLDDRDSDEFHHKVTAVTNIFKDLGVFPAQATREGK